MYKKLIALSLISAFALSACGGGSDDNGTNLPSNQNNKPSPTNQNQPANNEEQNTNPADTTQAFKNKAGLAVFKYTLNSDYQPVSLDTNATYQANPNEGDNFNTIIVNGKPITLDTFSSASSSRATYRKISSHENGATKAEYIVAPSNSQYGTAYSNYGWYIDDSVNELKLFYQGIPTDIQQIPQTGTATYKGYAIALNNQEILQGMKSGDSKAGQYYGLSTFNVDFANKKLTGKLNDWQGYDFVTPTIPKNEITIDAQIQANTFQGKANKDGYAEGKFYGPNAENLAGAFEDKSQGLYGVFGGKKQ